LDDGIIAGEFFESPCSNSILVLSFSEGWQNKELFTPFFIRSKEDPDKFVVGVFNRRDMWYLVRVYRRMPDKSWVEIFP
jgi:hypothetical protein